MADLLGINCVTGMSCLFRKHVLDDAGGMKYLGSHLAEDYYLGKVFSERLAFGSLICILIISVSKIYKYTNIHNTVIYKYTNIHNTVIYKYTNIHNTVIYKYTNIHNTVIYKYTNIHNTVIYI